ncbi:MAG TPA: amidohydrolase family protein [Bacteroidia bacterium]|jgi:cytosine/adenosine deaminase-related metal-dependent hydrolase|nr:amidohydrolase family protein [Bacteroidia bacterium]HMU19827.1 amidohydrolase family protein [Bacteroidia bacterium]
MNFYSADFVFPICSAPLKDGIVVLDNAGIIIDVFENVTALNNTLQMQIEPSVIQKFHGILIPGFINSHCHLELSHLKGKINKHNKLTGFVKELISLRSQSYSEEILDAIKSAEKNMLTEGIVAVGDISNTSITFPIKNESDLFYHTFIEVFDLSEFNTEKTWSKAKELEKTLQSNNRNSKYSISPHAPYTVTPLLFQKINKVKASLITIHNQETESENTLFQTGTGDLKNFFELNGNNLSHIKANGRNSIQNYVPWLNFCNEIIFVHNTFSSDEDIRLTIKNVNKAWWCFCPNANLYIENTLPDIERISKATENILIGTDSLASNEQLSILSEIKKITNKFPAITLQQLLTWSTFNGAQALKMDNNLGSLEKGKKPGLVLIENVDLQNQKITEKSQSKKVI